MIKKTLIKLRQIPIAVPLGLLVICVLAYGLLIPTLGYYWDDWPYAWINHMYGPGGYPEFVALDRPYSAWIFMALTSVFGEQPLGYHLSSLLLFWLCAVLFWRLLRLIWPDHHEQALWAALLFATYPGFLGHPQAIIYNHHFAAMALYLFSLIGMVRAIQASSKDRLIWQQIVWHLPALGALALSQFSIEYFMGWEAVRPMIAWLALRRKGMDQERRVGWSILHTAPYWLVSLIFLFWRVFIFRFPTYQPLGGSEPEFVFHEWILTVATQFAEAVIVAWGRAFPKLSSGEFGQNFWMAYLGLTVMTIFLVYILLNFYPLKKPKTPDQDIRYPVSFGVPAMLMAWVGLIFAGWPFWLTDLDINIRSAFNSRFTMAFLPWVALLLTAMLFFFYRLRARWTNFVTLVLIAFLAGGSTGFHFWNANVYRNEWLINQRYFQQMVHRIPGLQPGTSLVINDLQALSLYQDDSLTAILNWTYAPENTSKEMDYMVQYLSVRLGREIPDLTPGLPIEHPYRSQHFSGSTDQIMVVYYQPPGCLRVLDYAHPDRLPEDFPQFMIPALPLSDLSLILTEKADRATPPLHLFDEVTSETWCLYFEEADLAGQRQDWARVAELGDRAFTLEDQSNDVSELFVFIEGYLRVGRLDQAQEVSEYLSLRSGDLFDQAVCRLWQEVEGDSPEGFGSGFDLAGLYQRFCAPEN